MAIEVNVRLSTGEAATLSYQCDLIMLHTASTNAQFEPKKTGVKMEIINDQPLQVGFYSEGLLTYQSWFFAREDAEKVTTFFEALGYPAVEIYSIRTPSPLKLVQ